MNDLPIRQVNGAMVYVHDVAHVRDGFPPQTNIVRVDGQRAALITILKNGNASTLDIIKGIFNKLPSVIASHRRSEPEGHAALRSVDLRARRDLRRSA